jgi:hypothetical protein
MIEGSSFSGLLTRVEIGHIRISSAWERLHQVMRIRLFAKPARIITGREDDWHPVMDVRDQLIGVGSDDSEGPYPFPGSGLLPVLPGACDRSMIRSVGRRVRGCRLTAFPDRPC